MDTTASRAHTGLGAVPVLIVTVERPWGENSNVSNENKFSATYSGVGKTSLNKNKTSCPLQCEMNAAQNKIQKYFGKQ